MSFTMVPMQLLMSWLILALAFLVAARIVPGIKIEKFRDAMVAAGIFGFLNFFLGWILFVAIGVGTIGFGFALAFLTHWVVGAILLKITDALSDRITIDGIKAALLGSFVISAASTFGRLFIG